MGPVSTEMVVETYLEDMELEFSLHFHLKHKGSYRPSEPHCVPEQGDDWIINRVLSSQNPKP